MDSVESPRNCLKLLRQFENITFWIQVLNRLDFQPCHLDNSYLIKLTTLLLKSVVEGSAIRGLYESKKFTYCSTLEEDYVQLLLKYGFGGLKDINAARHGRWPRMFVLSAVRRNSFDLGSLPDNKVPEPLRLFFERLSISDWDIISQLKWFRSRVTISLLVPNMAIWILAGTNNISLLKYIHDSDKNPVLDYERTTHEDLIMKHAVDSGSLEVYKYLIQSLNLSLDTKLLHLRNPLLAEYLVDTHTSKVLNTIKYEAQLIQNPSALIRILRKCPAKTPTLMTGLISRINNEKYLELKKHYPLKKEHIFQVLKCGNRDILEEIVQKARNTFGLNFIQRLFCFIGSMCKPEESETPYENQVKVCIITLYVLIECKLV